MASKCQGAAAREWMLEHDGASASGRYRIVRLYRRKCRLRALQPPGRLLCDLQIPERAQLQPEVAPQVLHFRQVPFRTSVKFPHSPQLSPS